MKLMFSSISILCLMLFSVIGFACFMDIKLASSIPLAWRGGFMFGTPFAVITLLIALGIGVTGDSLKTRFLADNCK